MAEPQKQGTSNNSLSDLLDCGDFVLLTRLHAPEVAVALSKAGRRGKLPGYDAPDDTSFRVDCDAVPFEYALVGSIKPVSGQDPSTQVQLSLVRRPLMPTIFALTIAVSIWPGVWLTDSILGVYWSTYSRWSASMPWLTYAWYLPLTVLPLPWMWRSFANKSKAQALASARKLVKAIEQEVEAAEQTSQAAT